MDFFIIFKIFYFVIFSLVISNLKLIFILLLVLRLTELAYKLTLRTLRYPTRQISSSLLCLCTHFQTSNETLRNKYPKCNLYFLQPPDKPGKPEGPLEVSDVHADHVKLSWNKPKHTGGLPLSAYIVEKMDVMTGKWSPAGTIDPDVTEATVTGEGFIHMTSWRISCIF